MGYCINCKYRETVDENSIFFNSPSCTNEKKVRIDYVKGIQIPRKCDEINGYGECLEYFPNGLESPSIEFDLETNTVTIKGTNPFVVTTDGTHPDKKSEPVGEYDDIEELYIYSFVAEHTIIAKACCIFDGVLSEMVDLLCEIPDVPSIDFDNKTNTVTINSYNLVYYTTDGSEVTEDSLVYKVPFIIEENQTVKAKSYARGELSEQVEKECVSIEPPVIEFDPETDTVTISADDTILFSTDGSDIFDDADEYTAPFTIDKNTIIKAACIVDGELSEQAELECKVPSVPVISYNPTTKTVTITSDNTVLYTLDGSDVKKKDTEYTVPIKITETTTVKAKSFVNNRLSGQAELECTV